MKFRLWKRLTADQRANQWLDLLDAGDSERLIREIARHPKTLLTSRIPLLHLSILSGDCEVIEAFLQHGADPNQADRHGVKPLFLALSSQSVVPAAEILIRGGARVDEQDRFGATVLMYAAGQGEHELLNILLEAGANAENRDLEGNNALMYAAEANHKAAAELLLKAGIQPDLRNFDGLTAADKCSDPALLDLLNQASKG